jgi:hypothetical protein
MWFATPSSHRTCTDYSLPVSRRTAKDSGRYPDAAARAASGADPNFAPLPADDLAQLAAEKGHFALVEGKVLSVRESGGTIYLNFARRWSQGFSVTIVRRLRRASAAAGVEPKALEGRRIRVRGFIELRRGPIIEAAAPEQIEIIN